jgi:hypothetical protein
MSKKIAAVPQRCPGSGASVGTEGELGGGRVIAVLSFLYFNKGLELRHESSTPLLEPGPAIMC